MRRMVVETALKALLAQPSERNAFAGAKSDTTVESAFAGMAEARTLSVLVCLAGAARDATALLRGISKHEPHPAELAFLSAGNSVLPAGRSGQDVQSPACAVSIAVWSRAIQSTVPGAPMTIVRTTANMHRPENITLFNRENMQVNLSRILILHCSLTFFKRPIFPQIQNRQYQRHGGPNSLRLGHGLCGTQSFIRLRGKPARDYSLE